MFFQPPKSPLPQSASRTRAAAAPSRRRLGEGGFTLIELLAVLAIVAILASIVLGSGRHASETGKIARAKAELAALSAALESYRLHHGDYPRTSDNARLVQSLLGHRDPAGRALEPPVRAQIETARFSFALATALATPADPLANDSAVLLDPWGAPYRYAYQTTSAWKNSSFVLYSRGPDGTDSAALLPGGFVDSAATANADNIGIDRD